MAAPRLLPKKQIAANLADERRQEIERGKKIAGLIDKMRETLQEEEEKLERFRSETVRKVQIEIDDLIQERDRLVREINSLSTSL